MRAIRATLSLSLSLSPSLSLSLSLTFSPAVTPPSEAAWAGPLLPRVWQQCERRGPIHEKHGRRWWGSKTTKSNRIHLFFGVTKCTEIELQEGGLQDQATAEAGPGRFTPYPYWVSLSSSLLPPHLLLSTQGTPNRIFVFSCRIWSILPGIEPKTIINVPLKLPVAGSCELPACSSSCHRREIESRPGKRGEKGFEG